MVVIIADYSDIIYNENGEEFARPVYWPYDPSLAMTNISERQCKRGVGKYGSRLGHLAGQPEAIRLRDLKLLLRAREVAYSLLTCKVSEQEVEKMLFGLGVAIDMARSLLISQKGRKRYLREMLGNAVDAPFAGKARVLSGAKSVVGLFAENKRGPAVRKGLKLLHVVYLEDNTTTYCVSVSAAGLEPATDGLRVHCSPN